MTTVEECLRTADRYVAYMDLADLFLEGTPADREAIRAGWDFGVVWGFPDPLMLACRTGYGAQWPGEKRILAYLVFDLITEQCWPEWATIQRGWAMAYQSCLLAGLEPQPIFDRVAALAGEEAGRRLRAFVRRRPEDLRPEVFGLKVVQDEHGDPVLSSRFFP